MMKYCLRLFLLIAILNAGNVECRSSLRRKSRLLVEEEFKETSDESLYAQHSLGCFLDFSEPYRTLPTKAPDTIPYSVETCNYFCRTRDFGFFGLQDKRECYCGQAMPTNKVDYLECNTPCDANDSQICGGAMRNSVFTVYSTPSPTIALSWNSGTPPAPAPITPAPTQTVSNSGWGASWFSTPAPSPGANPDPWFSTPAPSPGIWFSTPAPTPGTNPDPWFSTPAPSPGTNPDPWFSEESPDLEPSFAPSVAPTESPTVESSSSLPSAAVTNTGDDYDDDDDDGIDPEIFLDSNSTIDSNLAPNSTITTTPSLELNATVNYTLPPIIESNTTNATTTITETLNEPLNQTTSPSNATAETPTTLNATEPPLIMPGSSSNPITPPSTSDMPFANSASSQDESAASGIGTDPSVSSSTTVDEMSALINQLSSKVDELSSKVEVEIAKTNKLGKELDEVKEFVYSMGTGKKIVFVLGAQPGNSKSFKNITVADYYCQHYAEKAKLSGDFLAWISDAEHSPADRFTKSDVPYALVSGEIVAKDWNHLTTGDLLTPISLGAGGMDYSGETVEGTHTVWTHTNVDGTWTGSGCNDDSMGGTMVMAGDLSSVSSSWTIGIVSDCSENGFIYCFEQ